MSTNLADLNPGPRFPDVVRMVVEIPKNSSNKYEYDASLGLFRLDRALYSPMHYPGDYGFVPGTIAEDGDPIDILALSEQATFPGCLVEVRPVGLLCMVDQDEIDQKIIAVPDRSPRHSEIHAYEDIAPHIRREIEHFFEIYKELEGKVTSIRGWEGLDECRRALEQSRERHSSKSHHAPHVPPAR